MDRDVDSHLEEWKDSPARMPLLMRGARQVGKTFAIEKFGHRHFPRVVTINLETRPECRRAFERLSPPLIIQQLELLTHTQIEPGQTLLFLDEIQACPQAITALRYFKEQMAELHVIGAGSLLEFALSDPGLHMPVGRVQFLYMQPLSFTEFLSALGEAPLISHLQEVALEAGVSDVVHEKLLRLVRMYCAVGGMPAVVDLYRKTESLIQCQELQSDLLQAYRDDFGKYSRTSQHKYLELLFERAPGLIAQWFKYSKVDPDVQSRDIKRALEQLGSAGLIYLVYAAKANGLPLAATLNRRKFKLLFLDIGLANRSSRLDLALLLKREISLVNQGALAEQLVGQQLLAIGSKREPQELYFWTREQAKRGAQVDYVVQVDSQIVPIEVKAGTTGRLKSLRMLMEEKGFPLGVRISEAQLELRDGILSVPFYLVHELRRLVMKK